MDADTEDEFTLGWLRQYLMRNMPGFVEACDVALASDDCKCVSLGNTDLPLTHSEALLTGYALLYAYHSEVTVIQHHKRVCSGAA